MQNDATRFFSAYAECNGHLRAVMAGTKSTRERVTCVSRARSQSRGARRSRVFRATHRRRVRRAADPLSPLTLRPLAGPQGYRLSLALPQLPSAARHGPDRRSDHLAISQAQ